MSEHEEVPRTGWKHRTRWFAAEFLVVLCGVLVALALQSIYQGRQDASREHAYLQQLLRDFTENESRLTTARNRETVLTDASWKLLGAIHSSTLTSSDSLRRWY